MQRPCRMASPGRLCRVNVKLTMWFAAAGRHGTVRPSRLAGFVQVPGPRRSQAASNRMVGASAGGVGIAPGPRQAERPSDRGGCSQHPPFFFCVFNVARCISRIMPLCTCTGGRNSTISAMSLRLARFGREIGRSNHGRLHRAGMLGGVVGGGCGRAGRRRLGDLRNLTGMHSFGDAMLYIRNAKWKKHRPA